ncbi:hypothetical protein ACQ86N_07390 [Puia sp. P3]
MHQCAELFEMAVVLRPEIGQFLGVLAVVAVQDGWEVVVGKIVEFGGG